MLVRVLALVLVVAMPAAAASRDGGWLRYVNDRFGFSFRYPAALFEPERKSERGDGEIFVAAGGEARLLVGAFENSDRHTVASYMSFIRRELLLGLSCLVCSQRPDLVRPVGGEQSKCLLRKGDVQLRRAHHQQLCSHVPSGS